MEQIYDSIKGEESWEAELVLLNAGKSDLQQDASSAAVKGLEQLRQERAKRFGQRDRIV